MLRLTKEKSCYNTTGGMQNVGGLWLLSALFAAPAILAKIGIDGVNSNLATAIRTIVIW